jgi:hypothetical protein
MKIWLAKYYHVFEAPIASSIRQTSNTSGFSSEYVSRTSCPCRIGRNIYVRRTVNAYATSA